MALVAYDYGSGSENEEDEPTDSSAIVITNTNIKTNSDGQTNNSELTKNDETTQNDTEKLFDTSMESGMEKIPDILSHLPKTKESSVSNTVDDKLEDFIPKYQPQSTKEKKSQKVKISIPALSEFEEEEEPEQKKIKRSPKGSNLLARLPPARGTPLTTTSFVPNVLKNKPAPVGQKSNSLVPQVVKKKAEEVKMATIKKITKSTEQGSDVESDDDIEIPETFDDEMWQKICGTKTKPKQQVVDHQPEQVVNTQTINIAPEPEKPYDGLDNAAFKELVGKAKRPVNIKLIDINEEEILPDKNVWLTKSLTDPDTAPKPAVEDPVDPTRKKKHHITYLAEQAKANEQELQSQWSSNKFARNQTRAKYGF